MFKRHNAPALNGGARVGQNGFMDPGQNRFAGTQTPGVAVTPPARYFDNQGPGSCGPNSTGCVAKRGFLGPDSAATVDQTLLPATIPGTSIAVSYTLTTITTAAGACGNFGMIGTQAVGTVTIGATSNYFIMSFTPRCPVRALAMYVNSLSVAVGIEFTGLFIGKQGANNSENLLMMTGPVGSGAVPADAFADLNACVPLLDIGKCATPSMPFILVGRLMPLQNAVISSTAHLVRAALVVETC